MTHRHRVHAHCMAWLLAGLLVACGGTSPTAPPAGGTPADASLGVIYEAETTTPGVSEILLVRFANPETPQKLNAPLRPGSSARLQAWNDELALYLADHDTAGLDELYSVRYDTPGVATKVSAAVPVGATIRSGVLHPHGAHAAYIADAETPGKDELYFVELGTPGTAVKVSGILQASGDVRAGYRFMPDGAALYYLADAETDQTDELYFVDLELTQPLTETRARFAGQGESKPGTVHLRALAPVKLNPELPVGATVLDAQSLPDSSGILYTADQQQVDLPEVWLRSIRPSSTLVLVNGQILGSRGVKPGSVQVSAEGNWIHYLADENLDAQDELFRVPRSSPGGSVRLNANLGSPQSNVVDYDISPDGTKVLYREEDPLGGTTMYFGPITEPMDHGGLQFMTADFGRAKWAPDSDQFAVIEDLTGNGSWSVKVGDFGTPTLLVDAIASGPGSGREALDYLLWLERQARSPGEDATRPSYWLINLGLDKTLPSDRTVLTGVYTHFNVGNPNLKVSTPKLVAPAGQDPPLWTGPGLLQHGIVRGL